MSLDNDPYFDREEVSNSDLSWLEKYWLDQELIYDIEKAYRFGSLLDAMITEPHKVNYFKLTCCGEQFTAEEFKLAEDMARAFWKDEFCSMLAKNSQMQRIAVKARFDIIHNGIGFSLPVRLKWDLWALDKIALTGDIKSTTAKTEKEFLAACHHFKYFRQRAWYMDIDGGDRDMLIGVSKVNKKVFKVPIIRGGDLYNIGKMQYQELAWKFHYMFGDVENTTILSMDQYKIAS